MLKKFYQIGKIEMLVTYNRYDVHEDGTLEMKHYQTLHHEGLLSIEELKKLAQERIAPGEDIQVVVAPENIK